MFDLNTDSVEERAAEVTMIEDLEELISCATSTEDLTIVARNESYTHALIIQEPEGFYDHGGYWENGAFNKDNLTIEPTEEWMWVSYCTDAFEEDIKRCLFHRPTDAPQYRSRWSGWFSYGPNFPECEEAPMPYCTLRTSGFNRTESYAKVQAHQLPPMRDPPTTGISLDHFKDVSWFWDRMSTSHQTSISPSTQTRWCVWRNGVHASVYDCCHIQCLFGCIRKTGLNLVLILGKHLWNPSVFFTHVALISNFSNFTVWLVPWFGWLWSEQAKNNRKKYVIEQCSVVLMEIHPPVSIHRRIATSFRCGVSQTIVWWFLYIYKALDDTTTTPSVHSDLSHKKNTCIEERLT